MPDELLAVCHGPHDPPHEGEFYYWSVEVYNLPPGDAGRAKFLTDEIAPFMAGPCPQCGRKPEIHAKP